MGNIFIAASKFYHQLFIREPTLSISEEGGGRFLHRPKDLLDILEEIFKNRPNKICGRQPLKHLKGYGLPKADHTSSIFLKAVFAKFYLVHS